MAMFFAEGSPTTVLDEDAIRSALAQVFVQLGDRQKVLAVPPDFTRYHSMAGQLTCLVHDHFGDRLVDVMPALGTHFPMTDGQLDRMFPGLPKSLIRLHDWRKDVRTIGTVPEEFVAETTEGIWRKPWPAQLNRLLWEGGHDLILSLGQVVPHEVIGMANHNKNLFVGTGGSQGINESHFIGAAYGMERMMGRADTPLRRILHYASENFCDHLPIVYILTVVASDDTGRLVLRGLFVGDDRECFEQAAKLSVQVNVNILEEAPETVVVYLDAEEFHSTWLGNKAVYRTRMAIADEGELIVLAPAVKTFGEDPQIDQLIRKYGYANTPQILSYVQNTEDLPKNLSAAAHLIHGSSEGRFRITYCSGGLTRDEIESVGYGYAELPKMLETYDPGSLHDGWNTMPDGQRVFFVSNPALGLWMERARLENS
jgi:nickel-dependent lactate racemase